MFQKKAEFMDVMFLCLFVSLFLLQYHCAKGETKLFVNGEYIHIYIHTYIYTHMYINQLSSPVL